MALLPGVEKVEDALQILDLKLKQLKHEYEQYFRGSRPREPALLRGEVQKIVNVFSNVPIRQTALRFRFTNLCARFFAFRRQWDATLRQIEDGSYKPHQFKADLHDRGRGGRSDSAPERAAGSSASEQPQSRNNLFDEYIAARKQCGEDVRGLTPKHLQAALAQQRAAIQSRYGCKEVRFRVVVETGRAKLKATPVHKD